LTCVGGEKPGQFCFARISRWNRPGTCRAIIEN
jgi:hypothetical protein